MVIQTLGVVKSQKMVAEAEHILLLKTIRAEMNKDHKNFIVDMATVLIKKGHV